MLELELVFVTHELIKVDILIFSTRYYGPHFEFYNESYGWLKWELKNSKILKIFQEHQEHEEQVKNMKRRVFDLEVRWIGFK